MTQSEQERKLAQIANLQRLSLRALVLNVMMNRNYFPDEKEALKKRMKVLGVSK